MMLLKLTKYNYWANQRVTGYILNAGEAVANQELKSSFNSILKTVLHIWDAQVIWNQRLNNQSPTDCPSKNFKGNFELACNGLLEHSAEFILTAEKFNGNYEININYKTLDGKESSNLASEIILHCMNHGTYHRGQLITMLHQAGFKDVGSTDYIRFCREMP